MDSYHLAELALILFEEAGDALVLFDPESEQILDVNPMAQRLSGFTRTEMLAMQACDLFRSENPDESAQLRHALKKTGVLHSQECYLLRNKQEGKWIPLKIALTHLNFQSKNIGLITGRDVREQRETHAALKEITERLSTVVGNAPVILFALDRQGVFTMMEGKGLEALGIQPDDLIGRSAFDIYKKSPSVLHSIQHVLEGNVSSTVIEVESGPGAGRSFETHFTPLYKSDQEVMGAIGIANDITERRHAEKEVQKMSAFLDSIIEHLPIMLFVKDASELRFERVNRAGEEFLGLRQEDLIGKNDYDFFPREEADFFIDKDRQVLREKMLLDIPEEVIMTRAGERILHTKKIPLVDEEGVPRHLVGISEDITERKRAEQRLHMQHALTRVLAESATLDEATPQIIQALCCNIGCEVGALWHVDRREGVLRCVDVWQALAVQVGDFEQRIRQATFVRGEGVPGRVWETGAPVWISDVLKETLSPLGAEAGQHGLHGAFGIPILLGAEVLGVMAFYSRAIREPDQDLLQLFASIGSQIGQFIKRKRAEEKLRQSEERFRLLVEGVKDYAIFLLDPQGKVVSWNAGAQRVQGYPAEEIIGEPMALFYTVENLSTGKPGRHLEQAAREGHYEEVGWWIRKDGSQYWASVLITALRNDAGQHKGFSILVRDLTERKRAEEAEKSLHAHEVESSVAHQIQSKLFPLQAPQVPGYDIGAISYSAVATGGDYYDYIPMLEGGLGIIIGDAAGHGAGPALLMASTRAYLRALALTHHDVGKILTLTNRELAPDVGDRFITLILARLDPRSRTLIYASAGHHPPGYLLDAAGEVKLLLSSTNFPLGVMPDSDYTPCPPLTLQPGESVLLLTDGLVEATSHDGTAFGIDRALKIVQANLQRSAQEIVQALYAALWDFSAGRPRLDDITVVLIKVNPAC